MATQESKIVEIYSWSKQAAPKTLDSANENKKDTEGNWKKTPPPAPIVTIGFYEWKKEKKKNPEHWILLGKPKKKEGKEGGGEKHTIQIIEFYE